MVVIQHWNPAASIFNSSIYVCSSLLIWLISYLSVCGGSPPNGVPLEFIRSLINGSPLAEGLSMLQRDLAESQSEWDRKV